MKPTRQGVAPRATEDRIAELLAANNREVERRRDAVDALRAILARIEGSVAADWSMRPAYDGTLADFIREKLK
jgi:hypothetical protein